ncbi:MAG: hypothetical protein OXN95_08075 [bacterium]|nr:hypothetical protein [bacterium]
MTDRDRPAAQRRERGRITEHFERGLALGETMAAAADNPAQVYRLALNALDTAELPVVQADTGQVALLMGIVSACAEWITADETPRSDPAGDVALADRARDLARRLAAEAGAITVEINPN